MGAARRAGLVATVVAMLATGAAGVASATSDPSFTCVRVNADTCTVTIPLSSNTDEQVGSTMPDSQPWYLSLLEGQGPYTITDNGVDWDGTDATQGTVWSELLTTGANEPGGSMAVLTFQHVNATTTTAPGTQPYSSISYNYPLKVADGASATVTGVVTPVPAKGHLILQRRSGKTWVAVGALTYSPATKKWSIHFVWTSPSAPPSRSVSSPPRRRGSRRPTAAPSRSRRPARRRPDAAGEPRSMGP
jgi:hypothetical protein